MMGKDEYRFPLMEIDSPQSKGTFLIGSSATVEPLADDPANLPKAGPSQMQPRQTLLQKRTHSASLIIAQHEKGRLLLCPGRSEFYMHLAGQLMKFLMDRFVVQLVDL